MVITSCVVYDAAQYYAGMVNAYSPDRLTVAQLKTLLEWNAADSCITRDMLLTAVQSRLHLGRLTLDDIARAA